MVAQALLLLAAVDVVAEGVDHTSVSNVSDPMALFAVEVVLETGADGAAGAPKSNRSPRPEDSGAGAGAGVDAAFVDAKKPPESGAWVERCGAAPVFFIPEVRFAKGEGFGGAACACVLKFNPPKESLRSPKADECCCICGWNEDIVGLWGLGCGRGADA